MRIPFGAPPEVSSPQFNGWMQSLYRLLQKIEMNMHLSARTFTASDATPSVAGGKIFTTANALATTITMFDDGYDKQTIVVIIGDVNTTVDFTGTHLKGNAGVDWVPTTGDFMVCHFNGTDWYCSCHDCTA